MKYLVFSDLHGSYPVMEKLDEIFKTNHCDKIICLGDILYHGPRNELPEGYAPKKVIEILKNYQGKMIWIQGNCDAEVDEMVLGMKFIKKKHMQINHRNIVLTHGHHLSKFSPDKNLQKGDIVLYGHYHVFNITEINGVSYINIGSPTIPKDGVPQYGIIEQNVIKIFDFNQNTIGEFKI